ncbi:MAG: cbb3-type cytochrome c oxidase subunit I [Magnetococcales bacterium]|nr:cbb3-type cytochrome c oxidase subunit I [Magnetococcales bacterium]
MHASAPLPMIPAGPARSVTAGWLALALYSLVGAGLVVILIILARTPVIHDLIPWTGSFKTALVIHVDLSVLVWFLSFAGVLAGLTVTAARPALDRLALGTAAAGAVVITFSPFLGRDAPHINNYVPILDNAAFFTGVALFMGGVLLRAFQALRHRRPPAATEPAATGALLFGIRTGLAILLFATVVWVVTWSSLTPGPADDPAGREEYFEVLYWGAGHILQFTHTQLVMVVWLWLAALGGAWPRLGPRWLWVIFLLGSLPVLLAFHIHVAHGVETGAHRLAYTQLMRHGNGVGPLLLGLFLLPALWRSRRQVAEDARGPRLALVLSLLLFGVGGVIGFLINGIDVTIPSHYHGSIVAITVAYMGLTYPLLPRLGYRPVASRWSRWQPALYAGGSLLHVAGLALAGLYGVQRKTHGAAQELTTLPEKLAMGLTGAGGLVAVAGGLLFLILAIGAFRRPAVADQ